ncbi:MAG: hypothetical protein V2A79_11835 [Planctomycetota bacterium]
MTEEPRTGITAGPEVRDWLRIFGAVRMAVHPAKLGLALAALVLTFCWGYVLDGVWKLSDRGVDAAAIARFVRGDSTSTAGDHGIAALWRGHTLGYIHNVLQAGWTLNFHGSHSLWESAGMLCHGTRWMVSEHPLFAILFFAGVLAIWSLFGSAICRIAAVEFAREEKIGMPPALRFVRERYWSGFFVSPLLALLVMLGVGLLMAVGGFFLWIPGVGNAVSVLFPLALAGGLAVTFVLIGCVGGGSFFWPTVAVEGSDGFDAISRSFSYFFSRPVKTIFYGLTALVWGGVCWAAVKFILWMTLRITHGCVAIVMPGRKDAAAGIHKLDILWPVPHFNDLYPLGDRTLMGGWEVFAAVVIGIWVLLAVGLLWAFLASYFFSSSTIIYYVLRHDVDATDYGDVYMEVEEPAEERKEASPAAATEAQKPAEGGIALSVVPAPPEPAPPSAPSEGNA